MIMYIRRNVVLLMQSLYEIINILSGVPAGFLRSRKEPPRASFPGGRMVWYTNDDSSDDYQVQEEQQES